MSIIIERVMVWVQAPTLIALLSITSTPVVAARPRSTVSVGDSAGRLFDEGDFIHPSFRGSRGIEAKIVANQTLTKAGLQIHRSIQRDYQMEPPEGGFGDFGEMSRLRHRFITDGRRVRWERDCVPAWNGGADQIRFVTDGSRWSEVCYRSGEPFKLSKSCKYGTGEQILNDEGVLRLVTGCDVINAVEELPSVWGLLRKATVTSTDVVVGGHDAFVVTHTEQHRYTGHHRLRIHEARITLAAEGSPRVLELERDWSSQTAGGTHVQPLHLLKLVFSYGPDELLAGWKRELWRYSPTRAGRTDVELVEDETWTIEVLRPFDSALAGEDVFVVPDPDCPRVFDHCEKMKDEQVAVPGSFAWIRLHHIFIMLAVVGFIVAAAWKLREVRSVAT